MSDLLQIGEVFANKEHNKHWIVTDFYEKDSMYEIIHIETCETDYLPVKYYELFKFERCKMSFPRYQVGDIVEAQVIRTSEKFYYLVLDKKFTATQANMADMYLALCLDTGYVSDKLFQNSVHWTNRLAA